MWNWWLPASFVGSASQTEFFVSIKFSTFAHCHMERQSDCFFAPRNYHLRIVRKFEHNDYQREIYEFSFAFTTSSVDDLYLRISPGSYLGSAYLRTWLEITTEIATYGLAAYWKHKTYLHGGADVLPYINISDNNWLIYNFLLSHWGSKLLTVYRC